MAQAFSDHARNTPLNDRSRNTICIGVYADWISPFKHMDNANPDFKELKIGRIHIVLLNLPASQRYLRKNVCTVAMMIGMFMSQ